MPPSVKFSEDMKLSTFDTVFPGKYLGAAKIQFMLEHSASLEAGAIFTWKTRGKPQMMASQ